MNIVSHIGPGKEGAISAALERLYKSGGRNQTWWYIGQEQIKCQSKSAVRHLPAENIPPQVCDSHYRFCNEFIWPVMHGLTGQAIYREDDFFLYKRLNTIFAEQIERQQSHDPYFVQNFQLALLPKLLKNNGLESAIFWQIPWPAFVAEEHLGPVIEIAQSLLAAKAIGFNCQEYADNFNAFVDLHLPFINKSRAFGHVAEILVTPLGIDIEYWSQREEENLVDPLGEMVTPYVLSIDKGEFSMGALQRLKAINIFFERNSHLREKITFVQICGRANPGIKAADKYWKDCQDEIALLSEKYGTASWQPLMTIAQPISSDQLAYLYRNAAVMLVTAVQEGLNLTAKEFIACQANENPGILALSTGVGNHEEFGRYAMSFDPDDLEAIADVTTRCLLMPASLKVRRNLRLLQLLHKNPLQSWCDKFATALYGGEEMAA
ncbi:trehalose-6-phosphate synthase [soil metagenome]